MALRITEDNYGTYKRVFEVIANEIWALHEINPSIHPVHILNTWEAQSRYLAKRGLKEGLRDSLSSLKHYPPSVTANISKGLEREKLPSLNQLLGSIHDTVAKVIRSNSIRTLDQYYIIKQLLDDNVSDVSVSDRAKLSACILAFEQKKAIRTK